MSDSQTKNISCVAQPSRSAFLQSRRHFLARTSAGLGMAAVASLLDPTSTAASPTTTLGVLNGHLRPRAKRVIYLFQAGGPSHIDLFDYKPRLNAEDGLDLPPSIKGDQRVTLMTRSQARFPCFGSPFRFGQHGQSGQWFSDLVPHMAEVADEVCFIKSMQTEPINHDPAMMFMQTGRGITGRPAMGSWLHYGLGSECANLPAFVVMTSGITDQPVLSRYFHSGFLPSRFQGVQFQSTGDPVLFISNPAGVNHQTRGQSIEAINALNQINFDHFVDPEIEARIDAFQMAYQMQSSVPELTDFSDEPQHILDMYGPEVMKQGSYAYQCLLARRLAEKGVRFVQLFHAGWDQHNRLQRDITRQAKASDQPSAALVKDLRQRGMLDDTLVVWGGEFGRTAYTQGADGRDHHPRSFTTMLAGGGIRGGFTYGATDEYGYNIAENVVHVRDFHATLLHCLGIDHQRFSYKVQGLDAKLTGVEPARVVTEILS
ncbi:MAG: DUF1501 domain-containing protein [Pirellulales bacterium]|nr:DUF1501 domain-containing protein [Pirellulales bacterium]